MVPEPFSSAVVICSVYFAGTTISDFAEEYRQAIQRAEEYGLTRLDKRNFDHLLRHLLD
jgi:hypothetical protein